MLLMKRGLLKGKLYTNPIELAGEMSIGRIPPVLQEKEVTPRTKKVVVKPSKNFNGLSKVTVRAVTSDIDENIIPENIKEGVEILGVTGAYQQGYFTRYENNTLIFDLSDRPISVSESELILK